ncbi:MAG: PspC domain-containing protein [Deltaproteobacteria bacterium]|nr:MAG: PspC domain-containing protein [Deltaproteobacteria bacterium]
MTRLHRSRTDRKLCGVCGGLGEAFDIDPNLIRIAAVLLFFFTGFVPLLVAYAVACFLLPEAGAAAGCCAGTASSGEGRGAPADGGVRPEGTAEPAGAR